MKVTPPQTTALSTIAMDFIDSHVLLECARETRDKQDSYMGGRRPPTGITRTRSRKNEKEFAKTATIFVTKA